MSFSAKEASYDHLRPAPPGPSLLERGLSLLAEVREGEAVTALLLMLNVFLLLMAYYILKTVREPLILAGGGAEIKSYSSAGQALLLMFIVPLYGSIASRFKRIQLINTVTLFFISNLVIFYFLAHLKVPLGVIFYLWVGIFNVLVIAQFWAFANDLYTEEQGKRLFAIIGFGSSLGAVVGPKFAGWLFRPLGAYLLMLVAAGILGISILLGNWVNTRERRRLSRGQAGQGDVSKSPPSGDTPLGKEGGFQLIYQQRYLLLIALMMLVLNFVNTTGEFILGKTVSLNARRAVTSGSSQGLTEAEIIGQFYSDFFFWVNLVGALIQMFAVSRIFKYLGVRGALWFLPVTALGGYTLLSFVPILRLVRFTKILENSMDYSVQNTARQALFLPTSREAKYKAKAAIDTFFMRTGDALSALLVFVGTRLAFHVEKFAFINIMLVIVWLFVTLGIARQHKQLTLARPQMVA